MRTVRTIVLGALCWGLMGIGSTAFGNGAVVADGPNGGIHALSCSDGATHDDGGCPGEALPRA